MKKHVNQMIKYEKRLIGRAIRKVNMWKLTKYCNSRLKGRNITVETILEVIKNGDLIEFHRRENSNRALLRGKKPAKGSDVACVVVDLDQGNVVTAYWNTEGDHHSTLDWSAYDETLNVQKYMRGELAVV